MIDGAIERRELEPMMVAFSYRRKLKLTASDLGSNLAALHTEVDSWPVVIQRLK